MSRAEPTRERIEATLTLLGWEPMGYSGLVVRVTSNLDVHLGNEAAECIIYSSDAKVRIMQVARDTFPERPRYAWDALAEPFLRAAYNVIMEARHG